MELLLKKIITAQEHPIAAAVTITVHFLLTSHDSNKTKLAPSYSLASSGPSVSHPQHQLGIIFFNCCFTKFMIWSPNSCLYFGMNGSKFLLVRERKSSPIKNWLLMSFRRKKAPNFDYKRSISVQKIHCWCLFFGEKRFASWVVTSGEVIGK